MNINNAYEFFKNVKLTEDGYLIVSGSGGVPDTVEITINGNIYKIINAPNVENIRVIDQYNDEIGSIINDEFVVPIPQFIKPDISINSVPFKEYNSGDIDNIKVKDENGNEVGSLINGEWIVPPSGGGSIDELKYFPLTNTAVNPVYNNNGNDNQNHFGQSYTFIPNDGLYFDIIPNNFQNLFYNKTINDPDIGNWNVSNIINMQNMFLGTNFNQDISNWDVSNVTNMSQMFYQTSFNQDIGLWNTSKVTNMSGMFSRSMFNQDIGSWDVSNVTNMRDMFYQTSFNQDIGNWNVSNVTNMYDMFRNTNSFNQDIGGWNVSNVTIMQQMFYGAVNFNQDLSGWCVTKMPTAPIRFSQDAPLAPENTPVWGTCP